jgi:4-amino-4-deoxychorismate lyase
MVVETTAGNFFWIKGRNVFTPALSTGALNGIIRGLILEVCKKNKIRVLEGEYEAGSIIFPEAMFITNSARGIVEVLNLNDTTKPTRTQKLFPIIKKDLLEVLGWT